MAWTVILETENKQIIETINHEFDITSYEHLKSLRMLCFLDPYGDTVFNRLQMDFLIEDLKLLMHLEDNIVLNEIMKLAQRCKNERHSYLAFYGD